MKRILLLGFLVAACGGKAERNAAKVSEPVCAAFDSYRPLGAEGQSTEWVLSLSEGTRSDDGCFWAGRADWTNGRTSRSVESVLEFSPEGRIASAPQDLCPDGPCGPTWSVWDLWEPLEGDRDGS